MELKTIFRDLRVGVLSAIAAIGIAYTVARADPPKDPPQPCRYFGTVEADSAKPIFGGFDINDNGRLDEGEKRGSTPARVDSTYVLDVVPIDSLDTLHKVCFRIDNYYANEETTYVPLGWIEIDLTKGDIIGIEEENSQRNLEGAVLSCFPNPSRGNTTIRYGTDGARLLSIYDVSGSRVREYALLGNEGELIWDGRNHNGEKVGAGNYFAVLSTKEGSLVTKVVLTI